MPETAQKKALKKYRKKLADSGLSRFEVLGRIGDQALIRSIARRLAEEGDESKRLRAAVVQSVTDFASQRGGIIDVFRNSPLVGSGIDLTREKSKGRKVKL